MEKAGESVRLYFTLSLLRIFLLIIETDSGSGFLLGDAASLSRCPVTVLRTQFLKVYREKCFEFVIDHETYWDNADKDCRFRGGHLATIGDKETQAFIMETLQSIGFNKHGVWIGLNDRVHEQQWVWATGESLGSYRNWGAQQSNGITHLTDDCVHLRYIDGGHWHDSPCHLGTYHYTYICQYQMTPTTTSKTSVRTSLSATATKPTASIMTSSTTSPVTSSKMTSSPSPTSQTMKMIPTAAATSTSTSTTSSTTMTSTTTSSTTISPTAISKATAIPIRTATTATIATTPTASSSTITTLTTSSTTETTKSTTIATSLNQKTTQATTEAVDAKMISSASTSQPATITSTTVSTTSTTTSATFFTVMTPTPPNTSTPTSTTDERKTPEPFKTIPPCAPLICGLDCGIFGFVYAIDGCPICACAT